MPNQYTVFYSWQSDDHDTRHYIRKCLEKAIKVAKKEIAIDARPELDEATKGVKGAVDIPSTVMKKICDCSLFVADLSFVGEYNNRKLVNQNVMFELGYAMRRSNGKDVVMLFNRDKGKVGDLPFDISHKRVLQFSMKEDENGERLAQELARIIADDMQDEKNAVPKFGGIELDDEELVIMKFFKSMGERKHIIYARELDGSKIYPMDNVYDKEALQQMINQGMQRLKANLDELVDENVLEKTLSVDPNALHYKLKKLGYNIIEKI